MTKEGLLIPKEMTDRTLGEGSEEVEVLEEPGRLLIVAEPGHLSSVDTQDRSKAPTEPDEDPILGLGSKPVCSGSGTVRHTTTVTSTAQVEGALRERWPTYIEPS